MKNETTIKSETIKDQNQISTVILTKSKKRNEWFRYIKSTNSDWNVEMGFTSYTAAEKRYDSDITFLKGAK